MQNQYLVLDGRGNFGDPDDAEVMDSFEALDDAIAMEIAKQEWEDYDCSLYRADIKNDDLVFIGIVNI
jgi:hypothetical protein